MAFGDLVQSPAETLEHGLGETSTTITLGAPATAGSLLGCIIGVDKSAGSITIPAGFTLIAQEISAFFSVAICYRVAAGGEQAVNATWAISHPASSVLFELEGPWASSPVIAQSPLTTSGTTQVASQSTGTSTLPTDDIGLAVSFFFNDSASKVNAGSGSWTNSFAKFVDIDFSDSPNGTGFDIPPAHNIAKKVLATAATQETTFSYTGDVDEAGAIVVVFGQTASPASVQDVWIVSGAIQPTSARINARVDGDASVALQYDTANDFSASPVTSSASAVTAATDHIAAFSGAGLTPGTDYYYRLVIDAVPSARVGHFRTTVAGATNFSFVFSGDVVQGSTSNVWSRMLARDPDFMFFLGDVPYMNISSNNQSLYRDGWGAFFSTSAVAGLLEEVPFVHVWDDHDYADNDSDASAAGRPAAQAAYRQIMPHYPLEVGDAIYHSFTIGRVRFIVSDLRSERAGTIMSATQLSWLEAELTSASADGDVRLIVWANSVPWASSSGSDNWAGFNTERDQIADHITSLNINGRLAIISADMHAVAADDGTNTAYGSSPPSKGPRLFHSAPMDQSNSTKGGPYTIGPFASSNGQYSIFDVADAGGDVTVTVTAFDGTDAQLYQTVFVVAVPGSNEALNPQNEIDGALNALLITEPNYNVPAGVNKIIIATVGSEAGPLGEHLSVTHDDVEFTKGVDVDLGANRLSMWYLLVGSSTPSGDVVATLSSLATGGSLSVVTLTQLVQQAPENTNTNTSASSPINTSVTTITDLAVIVDGFCGGADGLPAITQGPDQVVDVADTVGAQTLQAGLSHRYCGDAGSYQTGWSVSSVNRLLHSMLVFEKSGDATFVIDSITHGHAIDNLTLSTAGTLGIQPITHAHTIDNLLLTQDHDLKVAGGLMGHTIGNLALTTSDDMVIQSIQHAHNVDNLALTQLHELDIQSLSHDHTIGQVVFAGVFEGVTPSTREASSIAETRTSAVKSR